jgi:hypothetical protein
MVRCTHPAMMRNNQIQVLSIIDDAGRSPRAGWPIRSNRP